MTTHVLRVDPSNSSHIIQVFVGHGPVMGRQQPAFEQRDGLVDVRQQLGRRLGVALAHRDPVPVPVPRQGLVYARLLDLVAASSGRIINLHALSKDAGVSYETARRYLDVLEDTLIVVRVPAWSGSDRVSAMTHPKILLFDPGVRNALLRRPLDRPLDDERGLLLEHLVGLEIQRRTRNTWPRARLCHFRTRSGLEVDYVLEVDREVWAIEVRASHRVDTRCVRALTAFGERARVARRIVVFLGSRRQNIEGVEAIPLGEFLDDLPD